MAPEGKFIPRANVVENTRFRGVGSCQPQGKVRLRNVG